MTSVLSTLFSELYLYKLINVEDSRLGTCSKSDFPKCASTSFSSRSMQKYIMKIATLPMTKYGWNHGISSGSNELED